MAICGWCKAGDLKQIYGPPDASNGQGLEIHTVPNTSKTECKGPETYRKAGTPRERKTTID